MIKSHRVQILSALLVLQALILGWLAFKQSPTWDETGHLAAGISHWKTKQFDLYAVNPPLVRLIATAPVVLMGGPEVDWSYYESEAAKRSEVYLGRRMFELNGSDMQRWLVIARLTLLPIALLGTLLCYWYANQLFGSISGLLAAGLWAFSPTTLGFGSVITPDLASAVVAMALGYAIYRWWSSWDVRGTLVLAVVLAVATLVKSLWIFMIPVVMVAAAVRLVVAKVKASDEQEIQVPTDASAHGMLSRRWTSVAALAVVPILLVNAFYGFQGTFFRLGEPQFVSATLSGNAACVDCDATIPPPGNRFEGTILSKLPVPLPKPFVAGIDVQKRDFESGYTERGWRSYLLGEWQQGGWWYFYIVGLLFKEPLALWGALLLAGVLIWRLRPQFDAKLLVSLLIPAAFVFLLVSFNTGVNRYVRYVIPVLPSLVVLASAIGLALGSFSKVDGESSAKSNESPRWSGLAAVACLIAYMMTSLSTVGDPLSYQNALARSLAGDQPALVDSNLDWGQGLLQLQDWLEENQGEDEELYMAYFGSFDPVTFGFRYRLPPGIRDTPAGSVSAVQAALGLPNGLYAVSRNYLAGHPMPVPDGQGRLLFDTIDQSHYRYLQSFEPVARIGGSMLVYRIGDAERISLASQLRGDTTPKISTVAQR